MVFITLSNSPIFRMVWLSIFIKIDKSILYQSYFYSVPCIYIPWVILIPWLLNLQTNRKGFIIRIPLLLNPQIKKYSFISVLTFYINWINIIREKGRGGGRKKHERGKGGYNIKFAKFKKNIMYFFCFRNWSTSSK